MTLAEVIEYVGSLTPAQRASFQRRLVPFLFDDKHLLDAVLGAMWRAGRIEDIVRICSSLQRSAARAERWTPEVIARLGVDNDKTIARSLRLSPSAVAQKRRRLGIPRSPASRLNARRWSPDEDALLGTMSDRELGQALGASTDTVKRRRLALGIAPMWFEKSKPKEPKLLAGARYFIELRAGASIAQLARRHKADPATIRRAIMRYEYRARKPSQRLTRPSPA